MGNFSFGKGKVTTGHSWKLVLILVLTLTLAGLALPQINRTISATDGLTTSVFIEPSYQTAPVDGSATVDIKIANVDNLYAAEVHLSFPADLLEVQDFDLNKDGIQIAPSSDLFPFTPGEYYVDPGNGEQYYYSYSGDIGGYFIGQSEADNISGTINYHVTLLNPQQPVSAGPDGKVLATVTFRCIAVGTVNIDFTSLIETEPPVKLADVTGSPITVLPTDIVGAVIETQGPAMEVETSTAQDQDLDGVVVILVTVVRVKDPVTEETIPGVQIAGYVANMTFTPAFMEILDVRPGDAPFDSTPTVTVTGPGAITVDQDVSPSGVEPPVVIFRIVARLIDSCLVSDTLSVNVVEVSTPDGATMPAQDQPMVLTFLRGDVGGNGVVDIIDGMKGAQYVVGIRPVDDIRQLNMASVKPDGTGDIKDITDCMFIAQHVVGIRDEYFELTGP